jgi:hypothetical protein
MDDLRTILAKYYQIYKQPQEKVNLRERFYPILAGFENLCLSDELIEWNQDRLEQCLKDFYICLGCKGECHASLKIKGENGNRDGMDLYLAPHYWATKDANGKQLVFKVFQCQGPAERQQAIRERLVNQS